MPDVLDIAASGRAKCRGCERVISKGELRFGESLPNPFGEGETHRWFHLVCAACMRPEQVLPVLDAHTGEVPERAWLRGTAVTGIAHHRLPRLVRAERASSGRARCRSCHEPIEKGALRFALQMFEEDIRPAPLGFLHATCSEAYFGTRDVLERAVRLTAELPSDDSAELALAVSGLLARAPARADALQPPSVAKTRPGEDPGSAAESA